MIGEDYPEAAPVPLSKESVHRLAETLASHLNLVPGGDIVPVLSTLGGSVRYEDIWMPGSDRTASLYVHAPGKFEIHLPSDTTPERDRFTVAHEIGHYILHFLFRNSKGANLSRMRAARYGSNRAEWEANWFAAGFLMPEKDFRQTHERCDGDIAAIARHFCVSYSAAEVRARALNLSE